MSIRRILVALTATVAVSAAFASSASAQTNQQGLVNVAVEDVTVQVPISVAANICDVNVGVLARIQDEARQCEATADSAASTGASGPDGPVNQDGLVNVLLDDVVVQVPVAIAANICDLNVAVLAEVEDDAAACDATAESLASQGGGGGGAGASAQALDPIQIVPNIGLRLLDNDTTTDTGIPVL
ncbi:MAG TPA: hypothetical protein VK304_05015 [Thermoleophilaceae bacterium]|nr:hypothetical protein [Thermoleophilaceae bacterium]